MGRNLIVKNISHIVTPVGSNAVFGKEMAKLKIIENGAIIIEEGIIKCVGKESEILKNIDEKQYEILDCKGNAVLPGFVDSHTHFIFGGYREDEFSWRLRGDSYMSIMERGGGIVNTVNHTREASFDELYNLGKERIDTMIDFGVTTVEGKSGYGLDLDTEIKQLEVMEKLNNHSDIDVAITFMGAHATPSEYKGKEEEYVDFIIKKVLPMVKGKAEFCDVFCEKNVFSIEQSRRILEEGKKLGFKPKLHADEIVTLGGSELSGEVKAISADHLLQASDKGIEAMRDNKVVSTLLPCTAFSLKESYARGREMIDKGCAVALASDLNPGSCFTNSIPLLIALSTIYMNLSIEEVITALTLNGAAAIDRAAKIGSIEEGKMGDLIVLKYPSYKFLPYNIGVNQVKNVVKGGKVIKR